MGLKRGRRTPPNALGLRESCNALVSPHSSCVNIGGEMIPYESCDPLGPAQPECTHGGDWGVAEDGSPVRALAGCI